MKKNSDFNENKPVQDYWKFTRELKAQLELVNLLERQFSEFDDLCEYAIRNNITALDEHGVRVPVVGDLGCQQAAVYEKMRQEVGNLYDMLSQGRRCFGMEDYASD